MPNARAHAAIGASAGGVTAFLLTGDLPSDARLTFTLGGIFGGLAGGALPDILEPALHPWHRDFFHSAAVGGGIAAAGVTTVSGWVKGWLSDAAALRQRRLQLAENHPDRASLAVQEFALYFLAGAVIGLAAGYVSHVIADAATPRGIGLIGR